MIFFGGLALFLCVFLLGIFWPHAVRLPLGSFLWGYFVKALFISWFWFLLSFHTDLGMAARFITIALTAAAIIQLSFDCKIEYSSPSFSGGFRQKLQTILFISGALMLAWPALVSFGTVFTTWDAVVSWNRWASELSSNTYAPLTSAYPVFWPAVWSLIYEAQGGTKVWFISKASIAAPLIFMAVYLADKIRARAVISAVILCALVYMLFVTQRYYIVSGYMDLPLSLIGLAALLLVLDSIDTDDLALRKEYMMLAVITTSIALVTKQGGVFFGAIVGGFVLYEFIKGRISLSKLPYIGVVTLTPALTYLKIYLDRRPDLLGNLSDLKAVAARERGDINEFEHAYNLLADAVPDTAFYVLAIGIVLNFIFFRSARGLLGISATVMGVFLFIMYSKCCAYNVRNGYMIFSFLITSAFIGFSSFEVFCSTKWRLLKTESLPPIVDRNTPHKILACLLAASIGLLALNIEWPRTKLESHNEHVKQLTMGSPKANAFLRRNESLIRNYKKVVTSYQIAKFLPLTGKKYSYCPMPTASCIESHLKNVDKVAIFTTGRESPQSKSYLESAVNAGHAKRLAKENNLILYEFINSP